MPKKAREHNTGKPTTSGQTHKALRGINLLHFESRFGILKPSGGNKSIHKLIIK